jgi:dipeptidyl aminopeptidase/acylaminoacyl peptidase
MSCRRQVIHSELDYRLPISEGLAAFNVLQAKGVPSKLVVFPDENHVSFSLLQSVGTRSSSNWLYVTKWVLKHENSLVWHREVLAFINQYSGIEEGDQGVADGIASVKIGS